VVQAAVPVLDGDDEATLAARVLRAEHRIFPLAARWHLEGRLAIAGGRVHLRDPRADEAQSLWLS
jgi:phosphoribosylglycinamide formyltransferase-1